MTTQEPCLQNNKENSVSLQQYREAAYPIRTLKPELRVAKIIASPQIACHLLLEHPSQASSPSTCRLTVLLCLYLMPATQAKAPVSHETLEHCQRADKLDKIHRCINPPSADGYQRARRNRAPACSRVQTQALSTQGLTRAGLPALHLPAGV